MQVNTIDCSSCQREWLKRPPKRFQWLSWSVSHNFWLFPLMEIMVCSWLLIPDLSERFQVYILSRLTIEEICSAGPLDSVSQGSNTATSLFRHNFQKWDILVHIRHIRHIWIRMQLWFIMFMSLGMLFTKKILTF